MVYKGESYKSQPHGKGTVTYKDGSTYTGKFPYLSISHQIPLYLIFPIGNWEMGKASGYGQITFKDGTLYKGQWKNGNTHHFIFKILTIANEIANIF